MIAAALLPASVAGVARGEQAVGGSNDGLSVRPPPVSRMPVQPARIVNPVPVNTAEPLRLAPKTSPTARAKRTRSSSGRALTTVFGSLAVVLGVFFAVVWLTRRHAPQGLAMLPAEVVESLGRAPLAARQQMQLIRLGNRLLLLSVTPQGAETLAEVSEPAEVERLSGLCRQSHSGSVSQTFRNVLDQIAAEPASSSFIDAGSKRTAISQVG